MQTEQDDVIVTRNLTLGYDDKRIVTNLSIHIKKSEFIGILGPNGSGKSTFLRALLGLITPKAGDIFVLHKKPHRGNTQIGYMPQMRKYDTAANLTSRAILDATYHGTAYGFSLPSASKHAIIQNVINIVKAEDYADRPFQQLSGGERQRIFLAQSILGNPSILLLDEPLANLDPHYQEAFIRLLCDIQKNLNVTILFTAHDPNPLMQVMTRVLFFAKGKAALGTTDEVITSHTLSSLYGTTIEVIQLKNRLFVLGDSEIHHHD